MLAWLYAADSGTRFVRWIVSTSDRYIITYMIGEAANGIYAVSNKIPTILMIVANIFAEAWQISRYGGGRARTVFLPRVRRVSGAGVFCRCGLDCNGAAFDKSAGRAGIL